MSRHANYFIAMRPPISIMTYKKKTRISISEAPHNGLLSVKLLLRSRSRESYFERKLGVNLKAIHVESIGDGKCIGKRNEREMRNARRRSKITRVAGVTIYISPKRVGNSGLPPRIQKPRAERERDEGESEEECSR